MPRAGITANRRALARYVKAARTPCCLPRRMQDQLRLELPQSDVHVGIETRRQRAAGASASVPVLYRNRSSAAGHTQPGTPRHTAAVSRHARRSTGLAV